jgi:hypothetical protein
MEIEHWKVTLKSIVARFPSFSERKASYRPEPDLELNRKHKALEAT